MHGCTCLRVKFEHSTTVVGDQGGIRPCLANLVLCVEISGKCFKKNMQPTKWMLIVLTWIVSGANNSKENRHDIFQPNSVF